MNRELIVVEHSVFNNEKYEDADWSNETFGIFESLDEAYAAVQKVKLAHIDVSDRRDTSLTRYALENPDKYDCYNWYEFSNYKETKTKNGFECSWDMAAGWKPSNSVYTHTFTTKRMTLGSFDTKVAVDM